MSLLIPEENEEQGRDNNEVLAMQSIKKILPSVPDGTPLKLLERHHASNFRKSEQYKAFLLEYTLMTEYAMVHRMKIEGVYLIPSAGSPLKWFGVIFVRQGLYQGGVFRFILYVPDAYPNCDYPIVVFDPPLFHPLVNIETGEVDTQRAFRKWTKSNHLWQVILFVKKMFYKIETQGPLNPEAAVLYEKELELFKREVSRSIDFCSKKLYEKPETDDHHAIWFSTWDPAIHEQVRQRILKPKVPEDDGYSKTTLKKGLSWVSKGNLKAFSTTEL